MDKWSPDHSLNQQSRITALMQQANEQTWNSRCTTMPQGTCSTFNKCRAIGQCESSNCYFVVQQVVSVMRNQNCGNILLFKNNVCFEIIDKQGNQLWMCDFWESIFRTSLVDVLWLSTLLIWSSLPTVYLSFARFLANQVVRILRW